MKHGNNNMSRPRHNPRPRGCRHHRRPAHEFNRLQPPPSLLPPPPPPPQPQPSSSSPRQQLQTFHDSILRRGRLGCACCDIPIGLVYDGGLRQQPRCSCICHRIITSFETTRTTTAARDDDNDDRVITREIIKEYLLPRDYCVKSGKEEEGEGEICVVCFNRMEEKEIFKRLDCGHNYHEECITTWLLCKNSCPVCVSVVIPPNFTQLSQTLEAPAPE